MSTQHPSSQVDKLTDQEITDLIGDALGLPRGQLSSNSTADECENWDSMGILVILTALFKHGIKIEPGRVEHLRSVAGIIAEVRNSGG